MSPFSDLVISQSSTDEYLEKNKILSALRRNAWELAAAIRRDNRNSDT